MPVQTTYPGVYVEELSSLSHNIVGVSTSVTAFVDFFAQGPMGVPTQIDNFSQFQALFGGLDQRSEASYAIMQYFLNGGQIAWVVRVASGTPAPAQITIAGGSPPQETLTIVAANPGLWGENMQYGVDLNVYPKGAELFNLVIREVDSIAQPTQVLATEVYRNLSMNKNSANYAIGVVNAASALVQLTDLGLGDVPEATAADVIAPLAIANSNAYQHIHDGAHPATDGTAPNAAALETGIAALDRLDPYIFNLLCIPAAVNLVASGAPDAAGIAALYAYAANFCTQKRAFALVDIPAAIDIVSNTAANGVVTWVNDLGANGFIANSNSAIYFPRLTIPDPLNQGRPRNVAASGTLAGVYAATDAARGVWKSPAGIGAQLGGASLAYVMNDADNGAINPLGINGLRNFKVYGNVSWGGRTMQGADQFASQWAYIAVRRTALYIEESLFEGLKWAVHEPNDDRLWSQIRISVASFMQTMFRQGAFQGSSAASAYFVKCDSETTTQADINSGVVNVVVGFAPLRPAEFVILQIQQMSGQSGS